MIGQISAVTVFLLAICNKPVAIGYQSDGAKSRSVTLRSSPCIGKCSLISVVLGLSKISSI